MSGETIKQPKIILLYLHAHRVNDLVNWLRSLERKSTLNVVLLVSEKTVNHVQALLQTEHDFVVHNLDEGQQAIKKKADSFALRMLWREFSGSYRYFKRAYSHAYQVLEEHKEDSVLVTYDDRILSLLPILKASDALSIPVFLPAILTTQPDVSSSTSNTLKPLRKIESVIVFCVRRFLPHHVNHDGRLFYDPIGYLSLLFFRAVPERPWVKGTLRYTSKLGVESMLAHQKLIEAGIDESKLVLTGMPVYDLMDFSKDTMKVKKQVLLCALPQYGEHGAMNVAAAIPIIEEILRAFKAFSGSVIISLHPRMDPDDYRHIIESYGYQCEVGNIDVLLKKATIFFAASSSTTIYSSLIMGIPTVALNHIAPGSNIFRDFVSLTYIEKDASAEIMSVIHHPRLNLVDLIEGDQQLLSSELVTDGQCGERNLQVIQRLLNT